MFMDYLKDMQIWLENFLLSAGIWAPILSSLLVFLEGIFAFLPLFVFVTINVLTLGPIFGGIISWILTTLGCFCTCLLCRKGLAKLFERFTKNKKGIKKIMKMINNLSFSKLVLIIAIPFAPSFFINVAAGLSKIPLKKYFYALLIGKIVSISYLVYIGVNVYECLTNPFVLVKVVLLLLAAWIVGRIMSKKFHMDERF